LEATAVNRSALWVDIDGVLFYGGRTLGRKYGMSQGIASLTGSDFSGYTAQRLQAKDYGVYTDPDGHEWWRTGAPALKIAFWTLKDAMEKAYSIPIKIVAEGSEAKESYWVTFSAPEEQHQTLGSILSQMQGMGYPIGIDYASDVSYVSGRPTATITLSYPRRGAPFTVASKVIDLANALDLEYDEDGTQQADSIVEQAGALLVRSSEGIWVPTREAGYPLLEAMISHPATAPSSLPGAALEAYVSGDLATLAYPLTAPVITLPLFGNPSIFEIDVGDDVQLRIPVVAGDQPPTNPRFPSGLTVVMRIVRIDVTIPDEGIATMVITLNLPPSAVPVEPPEETTEGRKAKEEESAELNKEQEKAAKEKEEEAAKEATEQEEKEDSERKKIAEEALAEAEAAKKAAEEAAAEALTKKVKDEAEAAKAAAEAAAEAARKAAEAAAEKSADKARRKQEAKEHRQAAERAKHEAEAAKRAAEHAKEENKEVERVKEEIAAASVKTKLHVNTNASGLSGGSEEERTVELPSLVCLTFLAEGNVNIKVDGVPVYIGVLVKVGGSVAFMAEKGFSCSLSNRSTVQAITVV
jgi:hypothetical protein